MEDPVKVAEEGVAPPQPEPEKPNNAGGKTLTRCICQYLLAVVVVASVGWVSFWTAISSHTDLTREKMYPAFETKYFQDKAGARMFAYLGVFYLWMATVAYISLYFRITLPKPAIWLVRVRTIQIPGTSKVFHISVLEVMASLLVIFVLVATFTSRVMKRFEVTYWPRERVWYEVSKTLGKTAAILVMLLFFPVSKNCFWWDLFNYQFERAVKFHRWLAWCLVWVVLVHALLAIISLLLVGQFTSCMWPNDQCEKPGGWGTYKGLETSRIFTYGWIAVLCFVPLVLTSLPWVRRHKFEWFYYMHFLFVPFLLMVHLHYQDMIYYTAPGLAAYVLDKVVWFCSSRRRTKLVSLTKPAAGFVRMTLALDKEHMFEPGQWVQINVPAVSWWEWHPMSVASSPEEHCTIVMDIKILGDWTEKLSVLAQTMSLSDSAAKTIYVYVDKFHGSSHKKAQGYLNHPAVAMISGGIGVTPMMSALRSLVENSNAFPDIHKAVFVWCVKKKSVLNLYSEELAYYQSLNRLPSGCLLRVIVHATLSEAEDESIETPSCRTTDNNCRIAHNSQEELTGPFMQHVMGYGHQLILSLLSGGGFWFGIFLANFLSYEKTWRLEASTILQVSLGLFFASLFVAIAMVKSFCRAAAIWVNSYEGTAIVGSSYANRLFGRNSELQVHLGCRPDVQKIFRDLSDYCSSNGHSSVGVSVCGPEQLVMTTIASAGTASTPAVQFVVDEETFDW